MQDFHFTTSLSKASPQLMLACASGKHISKAILYVRKAGNVPLEYYTITLTNLVVSSFSQAAPGDSTGGDRPMESISFNFAKIKVDYYEASGAVTTAEVDTTPTTPVGG